MSHRRLEKRFVSVSVTQGIVTYSQHKLDEEARVSSRNLGSWPTSPESRFPFFTPWTELRRSVYSGESSAPTAGVSDDEAPLGLHLLKLSLQPARGSRCAEVVGTVIARKATV